MSYQVLALKYRPQTFETVVGQTHVTTTLANAIVSDRVAHAILFTGPRGTGKTTIARILAKAMNCKNGPTQTPCNTCKICTDIIDGHCSDVFEIDGASNNSVDQIRDLRENVTYMPSSAKYKIYIIDEVHMLSTAAFNALLKTLEEPPEHVMFIFATTEVHKIPATILSRCQRHDLGRISLTAILDHLESLCQQEGFDLERKGLELIAQEADGSIRDSLSLLDRVLSSATESKIVHKDILESLGILDRQLLTDISTAVFAADGPQLIESIDIASNAGIDLKKYYSNLIEHFRNLCVINLCGEKSAAVNLPDSEKEKLHEATLKLSTQYLTALLQTLLNEESVVKYASHPKTAVEMVLLKLLEINPSQQIDQILVQLDTLAKQISSSGPGSTGSTPYHQMVSTDTPVVKEDMAPMPPQTAPAQHVESRPLEEIPPVPDTSEPTFEEKTWANFLKRIEKSFPFIYALFPKTDVPLEKKNEIIVQIKDCSAFDKKRLESKKKQLQQLCKTFLGKKLTLQVDPKKPLAKNNKKKDETKAKQAAFNHPLVVDAQKMFNGQIINL